MATSTPPVLAGAAGALGDRHGAIGGPGYGAEVRIGEHGDVHGIGALVDDAPTQPGREGVGPQALGLGHGLGGGGVGKQPLLRIADDR